MSTLSLWLEPAPTVAGELADAIGKTAGRLGTQIFAPHVTVIGGFQADEDRATRWTQELARSFPPVDITFDALGFEDVLVRAAYLAAVLTPGLSALRARAGELFDFPHDVYMPHMSLAYSATVPEKERRD